MPTSEDAAQPAPEQELSPGDIVQLHGTFIEALNRLGAYSDKVLVGLGTGEFVVVSRSECRPVGGA